MNNDRPKMTSREIGNLTQTAHRFVLARALEQLVSAGVDLGQLWHVYRTSNNSIKRELHLNESETNIVLSDSWFSDRARQAVAEVFQVWNGEDNKIPF